MSSITPQVGGETSQRFYPPGSGRHTVVEKLDLADDQAFATFQQVLPPRCRLLAIEVKTETAMAVQGTDGTSTASRFAVVAASNLAAFTALATNATASNSFLIQASSNTASGTLTREFRGTNSPSTLIDNTTTDYKYLYMLPVSTGTRRVSLDGTNPVSTVASAYRFDGTQQISARIEFEQYGGLD